MFLPAKIFRIRSLRQSAALIAACLALLAALLVAGCLPGVAPTPTIPADAPPPPTPSWQRIYTDVAFFGKGLGLISGWNGTILRSTDAGETWSPVKIPVTADLYSVTCLDANTALAVGGGGNILRSTDAGETWVKIDSPTGETLNSVASTGGGGAVAVGWRGAIIGTQDGGKTWTPLFADRGDPSLNFQSVSFAPGGMGMAVSSTGSVYKSADAINWQPVTLPTTDQKLYSVDVLDNQNAFLAGNVDQDKVFVYGGTTVLLKTPDGGKTWGYGPRNLNPSLLTIKYVGPQALVAAGWDGAILRTNDGGNSWAPTVSHTTGAIRSIAIMTANNLFAVGDGETILHSLDGGLTWQKIRGS